MLITMNKPQRKPSMGQRESLQGNLWPSSSIKGTRTTPLLRSTKRVPLSAAKTNQRESYIGTASQHTMKDPRPISDKPYMKRCILEIIQLLNDLNYPNAVYLKIFNPPSNKDYQRVFEFLVLQITGSFRIVGKPDEEMLKILKDLGYPFNISKSTLNNVGAMSSWPQALGVLTWIADLARYFQGCDEAIEEMLALNPRNKVKQEYFSRCYVEFMHGSDGPYTALTSQLKETLDGLDEDAAREYEKQQALHSKLSTEYKEKMKEKEACSNLGEKITSKRNYIEELKQYLKQCDDYNDVVEKKIKEYEEEINKTKNEIASANQTLIELKSKITHQELTLSDVQKLTLEKKHLKDAISLATNRVAELKKSKWDLDIERGKLALQRDELVNRFNVALKNLSDSLPQIKDLLSPELKGSLEREDFYLIPGHRGLDTNRSKLSHVVQPFLIELNKELLGALGKLESEHRIMCNRVRQGGEVITGLKENKKRLQDQYNNLLAQGEQKKEEFTKLRDSIRAEIQKCQETVEQLCCAQSESVEESEQKAQAAIERTRNKIKEMEAEESEYCDYFVKLADAVKEFQLRHHQLVKQQLEDYANIEKEFKEELAKVADKMNVLKEDTEKRKEFLKTF